MGTRRKFGKMGLGAIAATPVMAMRPAAAQTVACAADALDPAKVEAWLAAYKDAWEQRDPEAAADIFTPEAIYHENVFDEEMVGRDAIHDYWAGAVSGQKDPKVTTTLWSVSETVAIAHWTAEFNTASDGQLLKLDGVFHLTFDPATDPLLCSHLREWWFVGA